MTRLNSTTYQQERQRRLKTRHSPPARVHDRRYFEVDLLEADVNFYSGFSDDITGIFIPTFTLCPIGEEVAIKLVYQTGSNISLAGHVEWLREYNPLVPETYPGLGVRLAPYDGRTKTIIETYVSAHPSLFFENTPLRVEENVGPQQERQFYDGLVRDITSLLTSHCSIDAVDEPAESMITSVISSHFVKQNFNGGFEEDDPEHRIFVETDHIRPIGTKLSITLHLEDGWQICGTGVVKWARKYNPMVSRHAAPPGLGICLTDMRQAVWRQAFPNAIDQTATITCIEH